jgi:peptide/nickel transport system substrate-binding protein
MSRPAARGVVVLVVALLSAFPSFLSAQTRREVRIGVPGVPAVLDPATALEGAVPLIARQVFDTLVAYRDGSTDVEPALATHWTVSRDGLVWSFTLRDGVRFHDGTAFTAAEAAASFERQWKPDGGLGPANAVAWNALLGGVPGVVKEIRAADARTLQIVLTQPYAPLLTVLAHPGFGIVHAGGADGRLVGTGPYRVVDAAPGRIAVEPVPGHWTGTARADRLVFLDVSTDEQAEAQMDARTLDVWFPAAPPRRAEGALSTPGLHVGYLAFQTERDPFARKSLRQAVAAALDPAVIAAALGRSAVPLPSFLPPGVWSRREGSSLLGGTRQTVAALLKEGGWSKSTKATLLTSAETDPVNLPRLAEAIQLMLDAAGISVQTRVEPTLVARTAREAGEHDLLLNEGSVLGGDPHLFLFPLSTSGGATKGPRAVNFSFYRNPRLDDVLTRASQLSFRPERLRLYRRAQAILSEEMPWLPIYVRLLWAVARPEVRGLRLHPTGFHRLDGVTLAPGAAP